MSTQSPPVVPDAWRQWWKIVIGKSQPAGKKWSVAVPHCSQCLVKFNNSTSHYGSCCEVEVGEVFKCFSTADESRKASLFVTTTSCKRLAASSQKGTMQIDATLKVPNRKIPTMLLMLGQKTASPIERNKDVCMDTILCHCIGTKTWSPWRLLNVAVARQEALTTTMV